MQELEKPKFKTGYELLRERKAELLKIVEIIDKELEKEVKN